MATDGSSTITVTAVAKDANNGGLSGEAVSFAASSGTLSASSVTTDSTGTAATVFNSNGDKSNRSVTITAVVGSITKTAIIAISGTKVTVNGPATAALGANSSFAVSVQDGAGNAVANAAVTIASSNGAVISASSSTTDSAGTLNFTYKPSASGSDVVTISATGLNATAQKTITTSGVSVAFTSPAAFSTVNIDTCQAVVVSGSGFTTTPSSIKFSASRGNVYKDSACATTGVSAYTGGTANAWIKSSSAGVVVVTADVLDGSNSSLGTASLSLTYLATTPSSLTVQAQPSTVAVNSTSSVTAVVRDANGNAVQNQSVTFSVSGGGQLLQTSAITDSTGSAKVAFKADSSITGTGAVVITATLDSNPTIKNTTNLTVAGLAVNITMGTDNLLTETGTPKRYQAAWGVSVTDSNGNPVANQDVTVSLLTTRFYKGYFCTKSSNTTLFPLCTGVTSTSWTQVFPPTEFQCDAEDTNNNGTVDTGEPGDKDKDGILEPNGAATVLASLASSGASQVTVTTDAQGHATFYVDYFKSNAAWVDVQVTASAKVYGQNSMAKAQFTLPVLANDITSTTSPAFQISPFGYRDSCSAH